MGVAGQAHAREHYVGDRHLIQLAAVFEAAIDD
jgi:hypothetical protein